MASRLLSRPAVPCALLVLALIAVSGVLYGKQREALREADRRFEIRAGLAAGFVESYVRDRMSRQERIALKLLVKPRPTNDDAIRAAEAADHDASVILDAQGRVIAAEPTPTAEMLAEPLGPKYPHLHAAMQGRRAASGVVLSAAKGIPMVAFALPFDTPRGRRVFSGGFAVSNTPLTEYVRTTVPFEDAHAYLVDGAGAVLSADEPTPDGAKLAALQPDLPADARIGTIGEFGRDANVQSFVIRKVEGTPWRLVLVAPKHQLHAVLSGPQRWVPWAALAALLLACGVIAALLARLVRTQARLANDMEARRAAEERFGTAFENAPIGKALTAPDGTMMRVNRALADLLGETQENLVGRNFREFTHPDDLDSNVADLQRAISGEVDSYSIEKRYVTRTNGEIWAQLSASVVRDPSGEASYVIAQIQDITERRRVQEQLAHMADHDPLSGLFNRRRFEEELQREILNARRSGKHAALLMLDLDNFKDVNDALGHATGDILLRRVSEVLRTRLRGTDTIGRLGGDEFAIVLPDTSEERATELAAVLLSHVEKVGLLAHGPQPIQVTASVGIAVIDPQRETSSAELLIDADLAMYEAKQRGKARVAVRDPSDDARSRITERVGWIQRIRRALREDRFVLYQQPILDLHTNKVTRHEILVRLIGDDGDHIPPAAFLGVAERCGLISEIDVWVSTRSIDLIAAAAKRGRRLELEVNLSGASITRPEVVCAIEKRLKQTGVDPSCLTFEITETVAIAHMSKAAELAERLRALGCRFALDDFGAGFGSFHYLKHLPFDLLKIDGEFVEHLTTSAKDQILVRNIATIARELGTKTVAEFVADDATADLLREYGIDYAQGYGIGRPQPVFDASPGKSLDSSYGLSDRSAEDVLAFPL